MTARLEALVAKWREAADSLSREADEQKWHRERKMYCEGKARAFRHCADALEAAAQEAETPQHDNPLRTGDVDAFLELWNRASEYRVIEFCADDLGVMFRVWNAAALTPRPATTEER